MIRRPPRSTLDRSSAASDVYKRQVAMAEDHRLVLLPRMSAGFQAHPLEATVVANPHNRRIAMAMQVTAPSFPFAKTNKSLSLIHISEPTRPY